MDSYRNTNGHAPITNGLDQHHASSQNRTLRVPTVDEALPFSPFSSIVPFNPNILPPPLSVPPSSASVFGHFEDVAGVKRDMERLSAGAKSAEHASQRCQKTLREVQKLLSSENLTVYKFKRCKRIVVANTSEPVPPTKPALGSFARMVFDNTKIHYRYPDSRSLMGDVKTEPYRDTESGKTKRQTDTTFVQTVVPPQQRPTARDVNSKPQVYVLPPTLTPEQRSEFQRIPASNNTDATRVTSLNQNAYIANNARTNLDQRQKGDASVDKLQNLLLGVFQAEDQMQPDTSEDVSMHSNNFFGFHSTEDGSVSVLQSAAQSTLDSALQKVASLGRLESIEVESLIRVQRVCENAIAVLRSGNLQIGDDWSDSDTGSWLERISNADNGLVAVRSLMRIMAACSNQKELQSEEYLRSSISANRLVIESVIIPVVEERPYIGGDAKDASSNQKFTIATENKAALQSLVLTATKCLKLLGTVFLKTDVDDSAISSIEDLCRTLIFAENASIEKDSALGTQTFESMRRCAMDVLAMIFTKYHGQRHYILEQILLSLEKLPATKQNARQFRLPDAKPIQLVSALLMRLIQSSATANERSSVVKINKRSNRDDNDESGSESASDADYASDESGNVVALKKKREPKMSSSLASQAKDLEDSARQYAQTVVSTLLRRAISTSKSSDEPFRKLLDIFTDDFLNVFGSSDWPSSAILLEILVVRMMGIIANNKSPAPARTLALELLGVIGSGIIDLHQKTRSSAQALDTDDDISRRLREMTRQLENSGIDMKDVTAFDGPFRIVIEYLHARSGDDAQLHAARGYHLMQWATDLCNNRDTPMDHEDSPSMAKNLEAVREKVWNIMRDQHWLEEHTEFPSLATGQGRLAARIIACSSKLSKAYDRIFDVILSSMNSEQPTIRSRSLKSVTTLLEKDPSILDRNGRVLAQIMGSLSDSSSLVRDSALVLIEKCVTLQPDLDVKVYDRVIARTTDTAVGVRKRAMKFLKQVYLRHNHARIRSAIANSIMSRIQDADETVAEIARLTIEEIWFSNFKTPKHQGDRSLDETLNLRSHASLMIQTVNTGEAVATMLEGLLKSILSSSKQALENQHVCRAFIGVLFDGIIDNNDIPGNPRQGEILQTLAVFAKAGPTLFTNSQLERLEPYAQNLTSSDDLDVYHYAITILRHTMPHLSSMRDEFLTKLQTALLTSVSKIPKSELTVVAPCLWTVSVLLRNTERLLKFVKSALQGVNNHRADDLTANPQKATRAYRLLTIVGQFGKACDFEQHFDSIKDVCKSYKGKTVSGLMVEILCHFTSPKQPANVREAALESVCAICQSWPKEFLRSDVTNAFEMVFKDQNRPLEQVLLTSLEVFFRSQEAPSDVEEAVELGTGVASGTQRLGGTYVATEQDGASASISQRFLPEFLRIALASCDDVALDAARIVVSINRQGMAHPRESGPSLIALETCPNATIAKMAFLEHKSMYSKHESVFEKELMRAVQQAFDYQRHVVGSPTGFTGQPPVSKFHFFWDVLKSGKARVRTKFFSSLSSKMNFDPSKLHADDDSPTHLLFVRFCVEALAFLDYDRVEELLHLMSCLEKNFATTGTLVAQAIESEVLKLQIVNADSTIDTLNGTIYPDTVRLPSINHKRLRQLAVSAQILSIQYETRSFLRRYWNMQKHLGKTKVVTKDSARAPTRVSNAATVAENFLRRVKELTTVFDNEEAQRSMCGQFVELMSVDNEVKVVSEDEEDGAGENGMDSLSDMGSPGPRGKKRKLSNGPEGPRKKGGIRRSSSIRLTDDDAEGEWV